MLDTVFLVGTVVQQDPTSLPSGYGLGPQVYKPLPCLSPEHKILFVFSCEGFQYHTMLESAGAASAQKVHYRVERLNHIG